MNSVQSQVRAGDAVKPKEEPAQVKAEPTTPVLSGGSTQSTRSLWLMKKTVLLVDVDSITREARSKVMRALGVTVHCAATVTGAKQKLESGSYNLVLLDLGSDVEGAKALAQEIRAKNPRQLVAFLVGSPLFVATSLDGNAITASKTVPPRPQSVRKANSAARAFDFGQKIRDAEAEETA